MLLTSLNSTPQEASANEEAEPGGMAQPIRYADWNGFVDNLCETSYKPSQR